MLVFTMDSSNRRKDFNGFLHVSNCKISKAAVNEYLGAELPGAEELGLDESRMYRVYRPAEELAKAVPTFNGLPILLDHHPTMADLPEKEACIGSMGTDAVFTAPYLYNSLTFTDGNAIKLIELGEAVELSCSYFFAVELESGTYEGQPYDMVMRNIRGNHVALVEKGRAGADVRVADAARNNTTIRTRMKKKFRDMLQKIGIVGDSDVEAAEVGAALALLGMHGENPATGQIVDLPVADEDKNKKMQSILAMFPDLDEEKKKAFADALQELAYSPSEAKTDDKACDADDKDKKLSKEEKTFAEGVVAGEHDKDRKDESEGMKKADDTKDEPAKDKPVGDKALFAQAFDAAAIAKRAEDAAIGRVRKLNAAAQDVRGYLDVQDALAFDSAGSIYAEALKAQGIDPQGHSEATLKAMWGVHKASKSTFSPGLAADTATSPVAGFVTNIRVEDM